MKIRETNLKKVVANLYGLSNKCNRLSIDSLRKEQKDELLTVYKSIGGCLEMAPFKFGSWDIFTDNFIIELDEEQHFNRYRKKTLESSIYKKYNWFNVDVYNTYCIEKENICLKKAKRGGYWKNNSTEKQFGIASLNGDFSGNGSPRWKQRAFYDFCRDLYSKVNNIPVYRFSIYDEMINNGQKIILGKALENNDKEIIINFLNSKIYY